MPLRKLLREDLAEARRVGDGEMVSLVRTLIAAIENAEAVDPATAGGVTEVPRRHLSDDDIVDIILNEGTDLRNAADDYERRGRGEEAQRLRSLADIADRYARTFDGERP